VIPDVRKDAMCSVALDNVEPASAVSTDELYSYNLLTGDGFQYAAIRDGRKEYALYGYRSGDGSGSTTDHASVCVLSNRGRYGPTTSLKGARTMTPSPVSSRSSMK